MTDPDGLPSLLGSCDSLRRGLLDSCDAIRTLSAMPRDARRDAAIGSEQERAVALAVRYRRAVDAAIALAMSGCFSAPPPPQALIARPADCRL